MTLISFLLSPLQTWVWLIADVCTIIWLVFAIYHSKNSISKQIINLKSEIDVKHTWDNINWDKIILNNDVNKALERIPSKKDYDTLHNYIQDLEKKLSKAQHIEMIDDWNGNFTMNIEDIK